MTKRAFVPNLVARAVVGAAALLFAASCAPVAQNAQWSEADSPKENKILFIRQTHVVSFAPSADALSDEERRSLDAFLTRQSAGYGDRIALVPATSGSGDRDQSLAARRSQKVASYLRKRGLKASADAGDSPESGDTVTVVLGRYVVIPPNCPDWRKPSEDDPSNTPSSNLGCATATNLGLMVADPGDLLYGKPAPVSDTVQGTYAVQRYRYGKIRMPDTAFEQKPDEFQKGTGVEEREKDDQKK
ncbi:MAG: CpaD family pilus assembly lipoprotein [Alphaproteobacteria bacterium]